MARTDRLEQEWKAWIAQIREKALEPDLPICDPHHHLWLDAGHTGWAYRLEDFHGHTASGHNIVRTVFLECGAQYRRTGPRHLRPVGEVEFAAEQAESSATSGHAEIAGIVGYADLALGEAVEEVIAAHEAAGHGRFRGIRYITAQDTHPPLAMPECVAMDDSRYLAGVRKLGALGCSYDAMVYFPQLPDLAQVARACPETIIVIDHLGCILGTGPYKDRREEILSVWKKFMAELAACPNTFLKLGGIGMPMMGLRWDKQAIPPTSEELAAPWAEPINHVIELFGPGRCMFESNYPVDMRGAGYGVLWNAFKRIAVCFAPDEKRDLFHDTAARAYRLPRIAEGQRSAPAALGGHPN